MSTVSTTSPSSSRTAKRTVPSAAAATSAGGRAKDVSSCASSFPEGFSGEGRPADRARMKRASARAAPGVAPRDRAQPTSASSVMPKSSTAPVLTRSGLPAPAQPTVDAALGPGRNAGRPPVPVVHHQGQAQPAACAVNALARRAPPSVEDTVQQVAREDRVAVSPRRNRLQPPRGLAPGHLVGDRQLPTPDRVEEKHAGKPRMAAAATLHILVEVELHRDVGGVRPAEPPLGAIASPRAGEPPERDYRFLHGMCRHGAAWEPESREVALPQALAA